MWFLLLVACGSPIENCRFRVSPRLRDDYANGKTYYALDNRRILTPADPRWLPSRKALEWHSETRFLR